MPKIISLRVTNVSELAGALRVAENLTTALLFLQLPQGGVAQWQSKWKDLNLQIAARNVDTLEEARLIECFAPFASGVTLVSFAKKKTFQ